MDELPFLTLFCLRLSVELSTGNVVTDHMVVAVGVETDDTLALNSGLQVRQMTPRHLTAAFR